MDQEQLACSRYPLRSCRCNSGKCGNDGYRLSFYSMLLQSYRTCCSRVGPVLLQVNIVDCVGFSSLLIGLCFLEPDFSRCIRLVELLRYL